MKKTKDAGNRPINDTETQAPAVSKKKRRWLRITLWALFVLCAAAGMVIGKFIYDIRHPAELFSQSPEIQHASATPVAYTPAPMASMAPTANIPTPSPTPNPEELLRNQADLSFMKNRANILVLGIDESTERENWGSFRTDTILLVSVNFDTNDVHMISIPRDSYVKIANSKGNPTGEYGKINSAFSAGGGAKKSGYAYTMGTVSYLLGGIPINYYVGFNMNVVKELVNAMGGIDYNVDTYVLMNGRELFEGYQHLDGQAVLDYCRLRHGSSDIARIDRQQRILTEILRQMKSTGQVQNIPQIYTALEQNIQTNLSLKQISALGLVAYHMNMEQLGRTTLPGNGLMIRKRSCIALQPNKIESIIKDIFGISVSVDSDISAAAIRERMDANRALIANELSAANAALATANGLLSTYKDWLSAADISRLKAACSKLQDAIDEEEKEQLDAFTPPLMQITEELRLSLQQMGAQPNAAPTPATTPDAAAIPDNTNAPNDGNG